MGAAPVTPKIPGTDYKGVYTMRSWSDFENIKSSLKDVKNIVIIGSGFIGMESASNLKKANKNANVTVVDMIEYPFERILGKEIGKALQKYIELDLDFTQTTELTSK
jgi:NADPH-dependent 2,4-dienoyl-CoA reductase/sulfur reductase-like enzyme